MRATVQPGRPTALVIHDDGDTLDLLTRLFEAGDFEVVTALTGFRAQSHLEGPRRIDVVVAPWDPDHLVGGDVYRWTLGHRHDLRDRFVFLASEVHPDFDRLVAGRCLAVSMISPHEVVSVAAAVVRLQAQLEAAARQAAAPPGAGAEARGDLPTLLLADDEPILLMVMADLFAAAGYAVTRVEGGRAAIRHLELSDYDAIVADWRMDDGNGADVYRWLRVTKPWLVERVVFLADDESEDTGAVAPGRPIFRKGADSHALSRELREIVRQARGAAGRRAGVAT
jgi:CheY-like chemotaxis protein